MTTCCQILVASAALVLGCSAQQPARWTRVQSASTPGDRAWHGLAYDSFRERTVLYGGRDSFGTFRTGTWEWDGRSWRQVRTVNSPGPRWGHAMAYDAVRRRVVLFGGEFPVARYLGDTWEYDGTNWVRRSSASAPSARHATMAFDAGRGRTVLAGGWLRGVLADLWEWDGRSWTERKPSPAAPPRFGHGTAFDAARQRVVVFGGLGNVADTWEWDGNAWARRTPAAQPPGRFHSAMAFDTVHHRSVLFGGIAFPTALADTWEWDGRAWSRVTTRVAPSTRHGHRMVYDTARQRIVLYGGQRTVTGTSRLADTWEYGRPFRSLTSSTPTLALARGGAQRLGLHAGKLHAGRPYWIFGSATGTRPGVTLVGVPIPLNPDAYTDFAILATNTPVFTAFRGVLDANGQARAVLNVPRGLPLAPITLHHAFVVHDAARTRVFFASNAVVLRLQ